MIFITVGSQKFQFNRLLEAVDQQVEEGKIKDEIFAQVGASDYAPRHFKFKEFLDRDEFEEWQRKAEIVITHGGTGAIIGAVKKGKKVIAIPRLKRYGEHVDDHQLQLIREFKTLELIWECRDCADIWKAVIEVRKTDFNSYESNTSSIIESIDSFLLQSLQHQKVKNGKTGS